MAWHETAEKYDDMRSFVADSASDVADLPIDGEPGEACLVISTGDVYVLGCDFEWTKLGGDE